MKAKTSKILNVAVESINFILINYALSNMAMLLKSSPLFILFFASDIWVTGNYWKRMYDLTRNKIIAAVLLIACFATYIGVVYFIGRVVGNIVPFRQM